LKNGSNAVFLVPASGGVATRLTPEEESAYKEGLSWHPSGEFLTYMSYGASGPEGTPERIRTVSLDGSLDTLIDDPDRWVYVGVWSPDGNRFYFEASKEAYVYTRDTGEIEPSVLGPNVSPPRWSGDGQTMAWIVTEYDHELWTMRMPDF
jgi:Tol biopolymer transport system component